MNEIRISVRNLVEFVLRSGDIDSRFTGRSRALEGTKIHKKIQKTYKQNYSAEVSLKYIIEYNNFLLTVEGRADGIINENNSITIDEIKTTTNQLETIDENYSPLHWGQAKCYAYIYAKNNNLSQINIQLTYYQIDTDEIKYIKKTFNIDELKQFFDDLIERYFVWAQLSYDWIVERDNSIKKLDFPYGAYRKGQRELAVSVYRTITSGKKLFAQAPTGIGKTISTLFPAIKAMGEGYTSKIFYLTAKTITRTVAEEAFEKMREKGLRIKTATLTAKEKICFKENPQCNPVKCEFAHGHFDRVNDAIMDILKHEDVFSRVNIEKYAEKHNICPFEFSLDLVLWSDVIICDYNYVFDPNVYIKRFFDEGRNDYTILIDEAHNLVDRSREMFSAEIYKKPFLQLKKSIRDESPKIAKALNKINRFMLNMKRLCKEKNYYISKEGENEIYGILREFINVSEEYLIKHEQTEVYEELLKLYFDSLKFLKISEFYDDTYVTYAEIADEDVKLKLFCLDPSNLLSEILKKAKASVFFSATLIPIDYYRTILGGNTDDKLMYLSSPFNINNRCLLIADEVSTRYQDRENSYMQIIKYIKAVINRKQGNYIVFFPSYQYMNIVYDMFKAECPEVDVHIQKPMMTEEEREEFLGLFEPNSDRSILGFCVLGGIFSEGIDLKHDRLIGAIIVGVGLPQICLERDIIRDYFQNKNNLGYEYAYMYPGMNKVLQAAGRVIRSENDRGVILLIDERFTYQSYLKLFPKEWFPYKRVNYRNINRYLDDFWNSLNY